MFEKGIFVVGLSFLKTPKGADKHAQKNWCFSSIL